MIRILIVNQPLDNRGDEAAHKALVRVLVGGMGDVVARVLFVGVNPDSVRRFTVEDDKVEYVNIRRKIMMRFAAFAKEGFRKPWLWRVHPIVREIRRHYQWADIILSSPGGICMGGFQNWKHLFFLELAKYMGKPVFYYGRSIGPFPTATEDNRLFLEKSVDLLKYFSFISLREPESVRIAEGLGVKDVILTTDTAFLDSPSSPVPEVAAEAIGDNPYVVFVPNLLVWHPAFKGKATRDDSIALWLAVLGIIRKSCQGHRIVMLPQLFNAGDGGDHRFFLEIASADGGDDIVVLDESLDSDGQQAVIRGASALFGARYHSIVFAVNNDTPFIAFSYEHKIAGLLQTLGLEGLSIDIQRVFDTPEGVGAVLGEFGSKVGAIGKNPGAREVAKRIAGECLAKFGEIVKSQNRGRS